MAGLTAAAFAHLMRKATAPQTWLEADLAAARRDPGVDWVVVHWGGRGQCIPPKRNSPMQFGKDN